jgi:cell division protein ZapA (FtsZ GTPase activity inhibitor)
MDAELRAYLERFDSRLDETRHHFEAVAERMDSRVDETRHHFEAVAERMDSRVDETRHHFDVVAEGMRADARLVAEGVSSLAERVDRVEHNLREEIRETRRDLTALLTASYTDLDRRVRRLEGD